MNRKRKKEETFIEYRNNLIKEGIAIKVYLRGTLSKPAPKTKVYKSSAPPARRVRQKLSEGLTNKERQSWGSNGHQLTKNSKPTNYIERY